MRKPVLSIDQWSYCDDQFAYCAAKWLKTHKEQEVTKLLAGMRGLSWWRPTTSDLEPIVIDV